MDSTTLMSALDVTTLTDTLTISLVSAGAVLHIIWTYLLGSLVMGLMAVVSTVIQRVRSQWLHNAQEQSPRLIDAGSAALPTLEEIEEREALAVGYAA